MLHLSGAHVPARYLTILIAVLLFAGLVYAEEVFRRRANHLAAGANDFTAQLNAARDDADRARANLQVVSAERDGLKQELERASSERLLLIEEMALPSLTVDLRSPRTVNPVHVDEYAVRCKWLGDGPVRDAEATFRIKGKNVSDKPLAELYVSVAGDSSVPMLLLNSKYYDLISDPNKEREMAPVLKGADGFLKSVALEFGSQGLNPFDRFSLEFSFTWPNVINSPKNYWYIHPLDFQEVHELTIELDVGTVKPGRVEAYVVGTNLEYRKLNRVYPANGSKSLFVFRKPDPGNNSAYLLVVDGK